MLDNNVNTAAEEKTKTSWESVMETEVSYTPEVNIYENNDEFVLIANTPGIAKEGMHVKCEEDNLTIFGKSNFKKSSDDKFILKETDHGNFYRRFKISDGIDSEKISATYENGQLTVVLPKYDRIKPRTINIK